MAWLTVFATLLLIHGAAVMSPGPNFLIVLRNAMRFGSLAGVITSFGVASGSAVFITAGAVGAIALLNLNQDIALIVRVLCGAYLIYLGISYLRAAWCKDIKLSVEDPNETAGRRRWYGFFIQGALTNLLNPKAIAYFTTLFTVFVPVNLGAVSLTVLGIGMVMITFIWYSLVSLFMSRSRVQSGLGRAMRWIEGGTGVVLTGFGAKLLGEKLGFFG